MIIPGVPRRIFSTPDDTALTTVYTHAFDGIAFLLSVNIAAIGAADATLIINDGSTDYEILSAKSLAADAREFIEWRDGFPLREGDMIKVQSSVADDLVFSLVVNEVMRGPA